MSYSSNRFEAGRRTGNYTGSSLALAASCRHWRAITPYRRLVPEVSAASPICWHFSAFARYRSDRDNIKPSRFIISEIRRNDLQSAKVWPTSGGKQRGLG